MSEQINIFSLQTNYKSILISLLFTISSCLSAQNGHQNNLIPDDGKSIFIGFSHAELPEKYDSVFLFVDEHSEAKFYYQDIFTPVCEDSSLCKPIYITLVWDLLGNYLDYNVKMGRPLTKIDHIAFSEEEYQKLHAVLMDDHSILGSYTKENIDDLNSVTAGDYEGPKVDIVTGATPQYIKDQIIEGALYTCHTIWHLSRGKIDKMLLNHTKNHLIDEAFLRQLISSGKIDYVTFALEYLTSLEISKFHHAIIESILRSDRLTASQIILFLPKELMEDNDFNQQLWYIFDHVHFLSKKQILNQFSHCEHLSDKLLFDLISYAEVSIESLFIQILKIIFNQSNIPENGFQLLIEITKNRRENLSGAVIILLEHAEYNPSNKGIRDKILDILK